MSTDDTGKPADIICLDAFRARRAKPQDQLNDRLSSAALSTNEVQGIIAKYCELKGIKPSSWTRGTGK